MNLVQIEHRALRALDRLRSGSTSEDDGVEFKRELPEDTQKAARQIAGMANAARGEQYLWLVGVDEKTGEIHPNHANPAPWWDQVSACFQGEAPVMRLAHAEAALVLAFDPVTPPYVIRTVHAENEKGHPTHEVPWRDGTRTRTAVHSDLVRMLVPILRAPEIEVLSGEVRIGPANSPTGWSLGATLRLYVTPLSADLVTLPAHRAELSIQTGGGVPLLTNQYSLGFKQVTGSMAEASNSSQLYCKGPGVAELSLGATPDGALVRDSPDLTIAGSLRPAPDGPPARFKATFHLVVGAAAGTMIWR